MFDDLLDVFDRDRGQKRKRGGIRGLIDRLADNDDHRDDRSRRYDDDRHDDDDRRRAPRRKRREVFDWDD